MKAIVNIIRSEIIRSEERVDIQIDGYGAGRQITWLDAMQMLDAAYAEEISTSIEQIDAYVKAAQAGLTQAEKALAALRKLCGDLQDRNQVTLMH